MIKNPAIKIEMSLILLFLLNLTGCRVSTLSPLEEALTLSGENRKELEYVLEYFAEDDEKKKAAEYLISNMPGHYSYADRESVDNLQLIIDSCLRVNKDKNYEEIHPALDSIMRNFQSTTKTKVLDLEIIRKEDLIGHINQAIHKWKTCEWNNNLTFDQFCEWILPYKVEELQPIDDWRDYLSGHFNDELKTLEYCDIYRDSPTRACAAVNNSLKSHLNPSIREMSFTLAGWNMRTRLLLPFGVCSMYASIATSVMRSEGIAVCQDFTPIWAYRNLGHEWNVVLNTSGVSVPFGGVDTNPGENHKADERMGKVFRRTYAPDAKMMGLLENSSWHPAPFNTPFIKDVTADYLKIDNLSVQISEDHEGYVYLALSNRDGWSPVDFALPDNGVVTFTNVGTGNVYSVINYNVDGSVDMLVDPFIFNHDGEIVKFECDEDNRETVVLKRKYPIMPDVYKMNLRMMGGKFQVSDDVSFTSPVTVHAIDEPSAVTHEYVIEDSIKAYRFCRYYQDAPESYCNMAEIELYDTLGNKMQGEIIGSSGSRRGEQFTKEHVFDDDLLTIFDAPEESGCWVGLDFGHPVKLGKIRYTGRGDGNTIEKGDTYELFYFKDRRWVSMGKKIGNGVELVYENVPRNALLLLRDCSKGIKERIFTYSNGRQIWW